MYKNFFLALLMLAISVSVKAQTAKSEDSLYRQIAYMDSVVFGAFNERDTASFNKLFSKDLEFYHDKGGLTGYLHTINFAKTQAINKTDLKRTLVPGSLEVYPIKEYGAVEIGSHKFCHTENGKMDCGTFKFVHIWKKTGNEWIITRVLSYDH